MFVKQLIFFAATGTVSACLDGGDCTTGLPTAEATSTQLRSLLQFVFAVFGAIAILMIIIGAIRFITSEGDPNKAKSARHAMVYALIGLVVAVSAEVIVSFVLGYF